jgi:hypothetical protein
MRAFKGESPVQMGCSAHLSTFEATSAGLFCIERASADILPDCLNPNDSRTNGRTDAA